MGKISCKIINSATKISRQDWERLFRDVPEGLDFYRVLEESKLTEFDFSYLALYCNQRIILLAPVFITDFCLDIAVEGWIKNVIQGIRKFLPRFFLMRTLFCGSPFGEYGTIGVDKEMETDEDVFKELVKGLESLRKEKGASLVIFKDLLEGSPRFMDYYKREGFFKINSFPSASCKLKFESFESYLKSLGHSTRKNLRRKIRAAYSGAKISVKEAENIADMIDDIYRLYLQTHYDGTTKFERLTKEFFLKTAEYLQPHVKYFLYYVDGALGAFNLCFVYKDLFIDKFIGFDYDISRKHHLYFVSWCYNVEWCIKKSISYYHTGQTDYGAKIRLGSRLIPLYIYPRHKNRLMNLLLMLLGVFLKPDNFDSDIQRR